MTTLKQGDKAPYFEGLNQDGKTINLDMFYGSKLVLFFYPKDMTPGCTAEVCSLRDAYDQLRDEGFKLLGVSADSKDRHQKFIDKYNLPFDLLSDPEKITIKAYGCWGKKKFMGREYDGIFRTTFVIDKKGYIERIITKVKTKTHAEQILNESRKT